jgi:hypothetical protein
MANEKNNVQDMEDAVREMIRRNQIKADNAKPPEERERAEAAIRRGNRFLAQTQH